VRVWNQIEPAERMLRMDIRLNLLVFYVQAAWLNKAERLLAEIGDDLATAGVQQRLQFLDCLGGLRRSQKRLDDAARYYGEALELAETTGRNVTGAFLWNSLGAVRLDQHNLIEAVAAFERAVGAHESTGGPDHRALIASLTNLGAAYLADGQLEKAQTVLERAKNLAGRSLGDSHPALYGILMLEVRMYERTNRKADAKQCRRRARSISRKTRARDRAAFVINIEELRRK
jgi:tetratricopeptide (TPR) repeat protein